MNALVYYVSKLLTRNAYRYDITLEIDGRIPLVTWMIIIYFAAFAYWALNYILSTVYDTSGTDRFIRSHFIGETICFFIFTFFPTVMTRPEITGSSIFDRLVAFTYWIDSPINVFPSIHCFASTLCFIGVRKNPHIPRWYKFFSFFMTAAICISTVTVKQHVFLDVIAGIALAEISYLLSGCFKKKIKLGKFI